MNFITNCPTNYKDNKERLAFIRDMSNFTPIP